MLLVKNGQNCQLISQTTWYSDLQDMFAKTLHSTACICTFVLLVPQMMPECQYIYNVLAPRNVLIPEMPASTLTMTCLLSTSCKYICTCLPALIRDLTIYVYKPSFSEAVVVSYSHLPLLCTEPLHYSYLWGAIYFWWINHAELLLQPIRVPVIFHYIFICGIVPKKQYLFC